MNRIKCSLGLAVSVLLSATFAAAETYHVAGEDSRAADANTGAAAAPWKTIARGVKGLKPGDTLLIRGGVYRETVPLNLTGEKDRPITIRGAEGERVILTGADPVRGWRRCSREEAMGNPNWAKLYVVDLPIHSGDDAAAAPRSPGRLIRDSRAGVTYRLATLPSEGMWYMTSAEGLTSFTDTENLTGATPDAYKEWTLMAFRQAGGGASPKPFSYDPRSKTIALEKPFSKWAKKIDTTRDMYYFSNNPAGIDGPGRYAWRRTEAGFRIWLWPEAMDGDQPRVERVVREHGFDVGKTTWTVFDGIEIRYPTSTAFGRNASFVDCEIHNCVLYGTGYIALRMTGSERTVARRNLIRECGYGITISRSSDMLVEENDIGWCRVDGMNVSHESSNVRIVRNYIHHHFRQMHPDGIQTFEGVTGLEIRDNVIAVSGQLTILAGIKRDLNVVNNMLFAGEAIPFIGSSRAGIKVRVPTNIRDAAQRTKLLREFDEAPLEELRIVGNTTAAIASSQLTNWNGKGMTIRDNVWAPLTGGSPILYGAMHVPSFAADYNLLQPSSSGTVRVHTRVFVEKDGELNVSSRRPTSIEQIRNEFGWEKNGIAAEPQFVNAPKVFAWGDYRHAGRNTGSMLILRKDVGANRFAPGDVVELNVDGVVRRVTAVGNFKGNPTVTFAPSLEYRSERASCIANWGDQTDIGWDLRLKSGSPGAKAASHGGDIGSNLDIGAFQRGDFNGDGKRDVPELRDH